MAARDNIWETVASMKDKRAIYCRIVAVRWIPYEQSEVKRTHGAIAMILMRLLNGLWIVAMRVIPKPRQNHWKCYEKDM